MRWLLCGLSLLTIAGVADAATLQPRLVPEKPVLSEMEKVETTGRVIVKFSEGRRVRINDGAVAGLTETELKTFVDVMSTIGVPLRALRRLHSIPEKDIDRLKKSGERRSKKALADLNLYYIFRASKSTLPAYAADRLNGLAFIELAEPQPAPVAPPGKAKKFPTPDFTKRQTYFAPKTGVNAFPRSLRGSDGRFITVVDVEYDWQLTHEDLQIDPAAVLIPGRRLVYQDLGTDHGTASIGIIVGKNNGFGVTGFAPAARMLLSPTLIAGEDYNPSRAIMVPQLELRPGDVMLLEMQANSCGIGVGPIEWNQPEFDVISYATANGIVVVEPAGNGGFNLDDFRCQGRFDRRLRDSGAIVVAAGQSTTKILHTYSNRGSRVDVQGWGDSVFTTGYGDFRNYGPDRRYTRFYSGTSSASAMIAGVVTSLQGVLRVENRRLMATSEQMRDALVQSGRRPRGGGPPLPDMRRALRALGLNLEIGRR